jgi:hypothetical protein
VFVEGDVVKILDLSAGNRGIWYDKNNPLATFLDKRAEVNPTIVCDTRNLPYEVGFDYDLVVWDPPHLNTGKNSNMAKCYGYHTTAEILETIEKTEAEVYQRTRENALMAFKWNDHDIKLERIFKLMKHWQPLFGHLTSKNKRSQTYWVMLKRSNPHPIHTDI